MMIHYLLYILDKIYIYIIVAPSGAQGIISVGQLSNFLHLRQKI